MFITNTRGAVAAVLRRHFSATVIASLALLFAMSLEHSPRTTT